MGGRVLEHEAKNILNEGRAEGRAEGRVEGRAEGRAEGELEKAKKMATKLYGAGVTLPTIAAAADVSIEIIRKWLGIQTV